MTLSGPTLPTPPDLSPTGYQIRPVRAEDLGSLLRLFSRAFPQELPQGQAHAQAIWDWKYGSAPKGNLFSTVAEHLASGHIVAHVGGIGYSSGVRGEEGLSVQSVDNMVDPLHRYRSCGVPVFSRLLQQWYRDFIERAGVAYVWGFPTQLNLRVGERAVQYQVIEHLNVLSRSAQAGAPGKQGSDCAVGASLETPPGLDALWELCRGDLAFGLIRDSAYFDWRYRQHPGSPYRFLACRDSKSNCIRGLAVIRSWSESPKVALIADWLVPLWDREASAALLAAAGEEAERLGALTLATWFPRGHAWAGRFSEEGFWTRKTRRLFVGRAVSPEIDIETLRAGIYATPGDNDIN